jgi:hypothetical protein
MGPDPHLHSADRGHPDGAAGALEAARLLDDVDCYTTAFVDAGLITSARADRIWKDETGGAIGFPFDL